VIKEVVIMPIKVVSKIEDGVAVITISGKVVGDDSLVMRREIT